MAICNSSATAAGVNGSARRCERGVPPMRARWRRRPGPISQCRGELGGHHGHRSHERAEAARAKSAACWWPDGHPELLTLEGYQQIRSLFPRGDCIPGSWSKSGGAKGGAAKWELRDGKLGECDATTPWFGLDALLPEPYNASNAWASMVGAS